MSLTWKHLIWKEWREHQWKLASLLAIVVCVQLALWGDSRPGDFIGPLLSMFIVYLPLSSAFIGMSEAASERSAGTLTLLQSRPVRLYKLAIVKLLMGIATAALPAIASIWAAAGFMKIGAYYDWNGFEAGLQLLRYQPMLFGADYWALNLTVLVLSIVTSVVLWISALGVNRESEVRAGAIGLVAVVVVWAVPMYCMYWLHEHWQVDLSETLVWPVASAALPAGMFPLLTDGMHGGAWWLLAMAGFLTTHAPLAARYILRFGRVEHTSRWSPQPAAHSIAPDAWLAAPYKSQWYAMAWKQFRESSPIVLAGFAIAVGLLLVLVGTTWREASSHYWDDKPLYWRVQYASMATICFALFGFLAGLIAGVGMTTTDFDAKHFTFWRSRPINVDAWFWTKFTVGFVMLLLAFGLPLYVGVSYLESLSQSERMSSPGITPTFAILFSAILAYSAAVLTGCVLRHTIYASLIGLGLALMVLTVSLERLAGDGLQTAVMLGASLVMALLAWLAVRSDWALYR